MIEYNNGVLAANHVNQPLYIQKCKTEWQFDDNLIFECIKYHEMVESGEFQNSSLSIQTLDKEMILGEFTELEIKAETK